jgi:hypothetical protein
MQVIILYCGKQQIIFGNMKALEETLAKNKAEPLDDDKFQEGKEQDPELVAAGTIDKDGNKMGYAAFIKPVVGAIMHVLPKEVKEKELKV